MAVDHSLDKSTRTEFTKKEKLRVLHQIIEVLSKFSDNYEKRLNFDKLAQYLRLSSSEADDLLSLILNFQDLFTQTFKGYRLQKKIIDNHLYLLPEKDTSLGPIPKKLRIQKTECNLLSDIIYLFKHVKKGKGFDVDTNGTDLLSNIKQLCEYYPFLFQRQNGFLYPSEFGLKLGELLLSYKKSNKTVDILQVAGCEVRVE